MRVGVFSSDPAAAGDIAEAAFDTLRFRLVKDNGNTGGFYVANLGGVPVTVTWRISLQRTSTISGSSSNATSLSANGGYVTIASGMGQNGMNRFEGSLVDVTNKHVYKIWAVTSNSDASSTSREDYGILQVERFKLTN
jgi:hypothetical protein